MADQQPAELRGPPPSSSWSGWSVPRGAASAARVRGGPSTSRGADGHSAARPPATGPPRRPRAVSGRRPPRAGRPAAHPCCAHSGRSRSEEHTSELQSRGHLVCRLLLEKKKKNERTTRIVVTSQRLDLVPDRS